MLFWNSYSLTKIDYQIMAATHKKGCAIYKLVQETVRPDYVWFYSFSHCYAQLNIVSSHKL